MFQTIFRATSFDMKRIISISVCMSSCSSMSVWVAFDGAALGVVVPL